MFGLLKGATCTMAPDDRLLWMSHICGLCLALKRYYGQTSRIATNPDAALLSVLCVAQTGATPAARVSRCLLRRPYRAQVLAPGNAGIQYAASIAVLMAATRVRDHIQDGETVLRYVRGIATSISTRWTWAAHKEAKTLGFDTSILTTQTRRQGELEAKSSQDFSFYAQPTELTVGAAFRHTAIIAGRPQNTQDLYEMGRMFGRIMYLMDSYRDYVTDLTLGKFNPLAAAFPETIVKEKAKWIFRQAHGQLKQRFQRLELSQPGLAQALLVRHLRQKGATSLQLCVGVRRGCQQPGVTATFSASPGITHGLSEQDTEPQRRRQEPQCNFCDGWYLPWGDCGDCDGDSCNCCQCERDDSHGKSCDCCFCDGDGDGCDCGDCDCGDCDCGDCDCGDCDCGGCDCGDCDCGDCDCGDCDCGDCDL